MSLFDHIVEEKFTVSDNMDAELKRSAMRGRKIRLWQKTAPLFDAEKAKNPEYPDNSRKDGVLRLHNVSEPSIRFMPADTKNNPAVPAVLVCPGGGYAYTAYELEGFAVCKFLNTIGISAFLLNYRSPDQRAAAYADAARAMRFIRFHAKEFMVDPDRIGAIGFSAGGHLCAMISAAKEQPYQPEDDIDMQSYKPDFTALIYPAYLADPELNLAPEFEINASTPPTLVVQTEDDGVGVYNALAWYRELFKAGVKAEMHLFECGGHGYGIEHRPGIPVTGWQNLAEKWFRLRITEEIPNFAKEVVS